MRRHLCSIEDEDERSNASISKFLRRPMGFSVSSEKVFISAEKISRVTLPERDPAPASPLCCAEHRHRPAKQKSEATPQ
jgi:hypothetical protein